MNTITIVDYQFIDTKIKHRFPKYHQLSQF